MPVTSTDRERFTTLMIESREASNLTRRKLSKDSDQELNFISRLERGKSVPRPLAFLKILSNLDTKADFRKLIQAWFKARAERREDE